MTTPARRLRFEIACGFHDGLLLAGYSRDIYALTRLDKLRTEVKESGMHALFVDYDTKTMPDVDYPLVVGFTLGRLIVIQPPSCYSPRILLSLLALLISCFTFQRFDWQ